MRGFVLPRILLMLALLPAVAWADRGLCVVARSVGPLGAKTVFRGRVLRIEDAEQGRFEIVHFEVDETLWGYSSREVAVALVDGIERNFVVGSEYLVYAESLHDWGGSWARGADYEIGDCTPTRLAAGTEARMQALREYAEHVHSSSTSLHFRLP